ncbi:MAG: hypothetical protein ACK5DG_05355 [Chitinophagaceae bacterium]|jgi:hypothetical protein
MESMAFALLSFQYAITAVFPATLSPLFHNHTTLSARELPHESMFPELILAKNSLPTCTYFASANSAGCCLVSAAAGSVTAASVLASLLQATSKKKMQSFYEKVYA